MMMMIIIIIIMCNNIITFSISTYLFTHSISLYCIFEQVLKMALYWPKHVAVMGFSQLRIVI